MPTASRSLRTNSFAERERFERQLAAIECAVAAPAGSNLIAVKPCFR